MCFVGICFYILNASVCGSGIPFCFSKRVSHLNVVLHAATQLDRVLFTKTIIVTRQMKYVGKQVKDTSRITTVKPFAKKQLIIQSRL